MSELQQAMAELRELEVRHEELERLRYEARRRIASLAPVKIGDILDIPAYIHPHGGKRGEVEHVSTVSSGQQLWLRVKVKVLSAKGVASAKRWTYFNVQIDDKGR